MLQRLRVLEGWVRRFVPESFFSDPDVARRAALMVVVSFLVTAMCLSFAVVALFLYNLPAIAAIDCMGALLTFIAPFVLRDSRSISFPSAMVLGVTTMTIVLAAAAVEGLTSPALAWLAVVPIVASVFGGRRSSAIWALVCLVAILAMFGLDRFAHLLPNRELPVEERRVAAAWNFGLMFVVVLGFCVLYETLHLRAAAALVRARQELDRTREQTVMSERMAALGRLAAGVAHEINNPSTFVTGNVRLARDTVAMVRAGTASVSDLEEVQSALSDALAGATRITETVRDLKTLGRAGDDRPSRVDASEVMDVALRIVSSQMRHRASLQKNLAHVPPVLANESRLGQVFVNLLNNAVDAMQERPVEQNVITVTSRAVGNEVCVEVQDNGVGIAPDHLARIFDPFFTTKPVGAGPGLGLSICRNLVEQMSGRIEVESVVGTGSTFRVWLPASLGDRLPAAAVAAAPLSPAPTAANRRLRVLVIDDDVVMCRSLERMLGRKHQVEHHQSAKEALARKDLAQFDAILCDLMMPELTGFDFYDAVHKAQPQLAQRIGFLSGGSPYEGTEAHAELYRTRLITKPFDAATLEMLLASLVAPKSLVA